MSKIDHAFRDELNKIAILGLGKKKKKKSMIPTFRKVGKGLKWGGLGLGALLAYSALKGASEAKDELRICELVLYCHRFAPSFLPNAKRSALL